MPKRIEHRIIDGVELKRCCRCKQWKSLSCFGKNKSKWDGLTMPCKECLKQSGKQYRIKYPEKIKKRRKQYCLNHINKIKKQKKQYYIDNIERIKKANAKKYQKNKKKIKQKVKQYRGIHKAEHNALDAKRRAMKRNQTPENANQKEIQFLYDVCAETNEILGEPYFHVDHIQPLAKCGLHHEDNLQILEATLNMEKKAKWPLSAEEKIKYEGVTFAKI